MDEFCGDMHEVAVAEAEAETVQLVERESTQSRWRRVKRLWRRVLCSRLGRWLFAEDEIPF